MTAILTLLLLASCALAASFRPLHSPRLSLAAHSRPFLRISAGQGTEVECVECAEDKEGKEGAGVDLRVAVEIEYCTGCRWMLRSAWLAQELLSTFEQELTCVTLTPDKTQSGVFRVSVNGDVVWDRKDAETPGFPEAKALKQRVRDRVAPLRDLGHSEPKAP
jgi:selenoprotein W-related protein